MADVQAQDDHDVISEESFLGLVAALGEAEPALSAVGAGLVVALHLGACQDSRTFARLFGVAHALVLREVSLLSEELGLVAVTARNTRTQRSELKLTARGSAAALRAASAVQPSSL